jgi:DNA-directed RNA polymerase subunit E'/Rpb7
MEFSIKPQQKRKKDRILNIYTRSLITRKILLPVSTIGKNLQENIEENIKQNYEGRCIVEGFVKPGSVKIITYSSGTIQKGNQILFVIVFECDISFPVEGMLISCVAKNITKAGIRAEINGEVPSPIIVFIAKDHHYDDKHASQFAEVKEGDKINIKVIGQRFELNDKYISIIGELIKEKEYIPKNKSFKPRLVIEE